MLDYRPDETDIGNGVVITGGRAKGCAGNILGVSDEPHPTMVLIELIRDKGNFWIEIENLQSVCARCHDSLINQQGKLCGVCAVEVNGADDEDEGAYYGN